MASSENESKLFIQEENVLRNANRYDDSFVPWRERVFLGDFHLNYLRKWNFDFSCDNFTRDINKFASPFPFLWLLPSQWMTARERENEKDEIFILFSVLVTFMTRKLFIQQIVSFCFSCDVYCWKIWKFIGSQIAKMAYA